MATGLSLGTGSHSSGLQAARIVLGPTGGECPVFQLVRETQDSAAEQYEGKTLGPSKTLSVQRLDTSTRPSDTEDVELVLAFPQTTICCHAGARSSARERSSSPGQCSSVVRVSTCAPKGRFDSQLRACTLGGRFDPGPRSGHVREAAN